MGTSVRPYQEMPGRWKVDQYVIRRFHGNQRTYDRTKMDQRLTGFDYLSHLKWDLAGEVQKLSDLRAKTEAKNHKDVWKLSKPTNLRNI